MKQVEIRKIDNFYYVFDDDCYTLYNLFKYKIQNNKTGFPISALNKVINTLEEKNINYIIKNEEKANNFKKKNTYQKYLENGKKEYQKKQIDLNITEKIKELNEEQTKDLYNLILEKLYERKIYNS